MQKASNVVTREQKTTFKLSLNVDSFVCRGKKVCIVQINAQSAPVHSSPLSAPEPIHLQ